jgi:hypothetical protein
MPSEIGNFFADVSWNKVWHESFATGARFQVSVLGATAINETETGGHQENCE